MNCMDYIDDTISVWSQFTFIESKQREHSLKCPLLEENTLFRMTRQNNEDSLLISELSL